MSAIFLRWDTEDADSRSTRHFALQSDKRAKAPAKSVSSRAIQLLSKSDHPPLAFSIAN